jgi:hypothetical protein
LLSFPLPSSSFLSPFFSFLHILMSCYLTEVRKGFKQSFRHQFKYLFLFFCACVISLIPSLLSPFFVFVLFFPFSRIVAIIFPTSPFSFYSPTHTFSCPSPNRNVTHTRSMSTCIPSSSFFHSLLLISHHPLSCVLLLIHPSINQIKRIKFFGSIHSTRSYNCFSFFLPFYFYFYFYFLLTFFVFVFVFLFFS